MAQNLGGFLYFLFAGLVVWMLFVQGRAFMKTQLLLSQITERLREIEQPVPPINSFTALRLMFSRDVHGDYLIQRLKQQLRWTVVSSLLLILGVSLAALILAAIIGRVFGR